MSVTTTPETDRQRRPRRQLKVKRVYDTPQASDGMRVLIDRLWPRGLSKARAALDLWLKDAAPSAALRRWYGHDPRRWKGFVRKYRSEIGKRDAALGLLQGMRSRGRLTLLYGSRDTEHNHALLLRDVLEKGDAKQARTKE
jgi:uncharacterized protein YeaO (DUF488 family)